MNIEIKTAIENDSDQSGKCDLIFNLFLFVFIVDVLWKPSRPSPYLKHIAHVFLLMQEEFGQNEIT